MGAPDIRVELAFRVISGRNAREHWSKRASNERVHRIAVRSHVRMALGYCFTQARTAPRPRVLLTRIGPRRLDSDNAVEALKAVRDGTACAMYCSPHAGQCRGNVDSDEFTRWEYGQEIGKYGIRIEIWR